MIQVVMKPVPNYWYSYVMVFFVLSVGRRSDRARKRRPVKIVSFDTDNAGTNSAPASNVVSPTVLMSSVHNVAVSAKTLMSSRELGDGTVNIAKTWSDDLTSISHSEAVDVGSLPDSGAEPLASSVEISDGATLPKRASKIESEFSIYRNSSLPDMGNDFGSDVFDGCSEDATNVSSRDVNELMYSSSSTVKPDDSEGPQDLPSDNAWFGAVRDRTSVRSADAESIASNASTESSSSANNHTRSVSRV